MSAAAIGPDAFRAAVGRLAAAGVEAPAGDARRLRRWAEAAGGDVAARFAAAVERRAARAPMSHVLGERLFWGRAFRVTPDVLDPRPETETLVAHALAGPPARRIIDLGVGSGCILLTLLAEWPGANGLGLDASPAALAVARANAEALGVAGRARLARSDWLAGVAETADLIVANPPYLSAADMDARQPELRAEPALALDGGPDGLDAYRRIAADLARALAPGGRALLEVGAGQGEAVAALLRVAGLARIEAVADMDGRLRVLEAAAGA